MVRFADARVPNRFVCKDGFVCEASQTCLPMSKVCDGHPHCPLKDDEIMCNLECPTGCVCSGFYVECRMATYINITYITVMAMPARVINLSENIHTTSTFSISTPMPYLYSLNISMCNITEFGSTPFYNARNLLTLDIRRNQFKEINANTFTGLKKLRTLLLDFNERLRSISPMSFVDLINIKELSIRGSGLKLLQKDTFSGLNLRLLDLSYNTLSSIEDFAFNNLKCNEIYLLDSDIHSFGKGMFYGATEVRHLVTPAFKFCCIRPAGLQENDCLPQKDAFSSCEDLMRNRTLQILLWVIGIMALVGNVLSLVYRIAIDNKRLTIGFGIFVTNLALADFFMGLYLIIIAVADVYYRDR